MKTLKGVWNLFGFFLLVVFVVLLLRTRDGSDPADLAIALVGFIAFLALVYFPIHIYLNRQVAKLESHSGGACVGCGYNLAGIGAAQCPECGRDVTYDETGVSQKSTLTWLEPKGLAFEDFDLRFDVSPLDVDLASRAAIDAMPAMQALLRKRRRDAYVAGAGFLGVAVMLGAINLTLETSASLHLLTFALGGIGLVSLWSGWRGVNKSVNDSQAQLRSLVRSNDPERGKTYAMHLCATSRGVLYESPVDRLEMSWVQVRNIHVLDQGAVLITGEGGGVFAPRAAFESVGSFRHFVRQARAAIDDVRAQAGLPARPTLPDESEPDAPPTTPVGLRCHLCGYDVSAVPGGVCPECGPNVKANSPSGPIT